jgi:hypothetical protein
MRRLRLLSILLVAFAVCLPGSGLAAQRAVLVESFTNVSCGPCATQNPITHQFISDYTALRAVNIQYHMSWPSATDPFYVANTAENYARRIYYGVNAVPMLETDGSGTTTGSYPALETAAKYRLGVPAPLDMDATASIAADSISVGIQITAETTVPASGLKLRVAIVEPYVHYATPPGNNGEVDFYCTMRKFLPDAPGTTLTINSGQTLNFNFKGYANPAWRDVYIVAWVQDDNTKEVLQSVTTLANTTNYAFFYGWYDHADVSPMGTLRAYNSLISNIGVLEDTYNVQIAQSLPAGWGVSVCANGQCYPPWQTDFTLTVQPDAQDSIRVDIQPLDTTGSGTVTITATSQNNPAEVWTQYFKVISDGITVLIVDDDGGQTYENSFVQALAANGVSSYASWVRGADGPLAASKLDYFHTIMWETGLETPTLDPTDRANLGSYLDAGGLLFIAGQDIGWDMCDSTSAGSGNSTVDSRAWYRNYLGSRWIRDDTNDMSLTGVAGDPIGDGLTLTLSGATQTYPDEIHPYGTGVGFLLYVANQEAAVHKQTGSSKVAYLGFGFEGLTNVTQRNLLMQRVLHWLGTDLVAVDEPGITAPYLASRPIVGPNPFNPLAHIKFTIGGTGTTQTDVALFDIQGRRVRTLWKGGMAAGAHDLIWDGRSQSGRQMPSGVYLARVSVNGESKSVKMILAK